MAELRFDGKTVIVTGAGRGVGRCHALLLASRGARIVVADHGGSAEGSGSSATPAEDVVDEIVTAGGEAVACFASVAEEAGAASIVDTALDEFGRVDVLINNAGISEPDLFEALPLDHFRRMIDVHYLGTLYVTRAAWPHLKEAGQARIVNTCSEGMLGIHHKITGYGAAKGAVFGLTRTLASEGLRYGIRVNAVAPRARTRMSDAATMSKIFDVPAEALEDRMGDFPPEHVAPVAAFLAHESCKLNGEVLVAGGGRVIRLAVLESPGISPSELTPESVAAGLDALLDMTDAEVMTVQSPVDHGVRGKG